MQTDPTWTELETPRLLLRTLPETALPGFLDAHLDTWHRWFNAAPVNRTLPNPGPVSRETVAQILGQIAQLPIDQGIHYILWTRAPLQPIGAVGLGARDLQNQHAGLSAFIGEPDNWGKGYITEAVGRVLELSFGPLGLRKVWLNHHGFSAAARRVADKLGFQEVGRQRAHCLVDGQWVDWITMELFAPALR